MQNPLARNSLYFRLSVGTPSTPLESPLSGCNTASYEFIFLVRNEEAEGSNRGRAGPRNVTVSLSERSLPCFCVLLRRQLLAQKAFQHFWCDIEGGGLETRYTGTKIKQPQCGSFL